MRLKSSLERKERLELHPSTDGSRQRNLIAISIVTTVANNLIEIKARSSFAEAQVMAGSGGPQAQDELQLLERVFLRLGNADTEEQLQEAVTKFLAPVLLKLTSQNEGVRKKVMELLVHINKRIKNNTNIQLPVEALLLQYQDPSATSFVINFTIIYLKMGFPRLPMEKQAELVPSVLAGIEAKPSMHQDSLLLMIMPVLGEVAKTAPTDPEKKRALLGLCEKPSVSKVLNSFMFDYLLLPYGSHPSIKPAEGAKDTGIQVEI